MGHERLENLSEGRPFEAEYDAELDETETNALEVFLEDVEDAYADNSGQWRSADDQLRVRTVSTTPVPTIRASVEAISAGHSTRDVTFAYEANTDTKLTFDIQSEEQDAYIEKTVEATPERNRARWTVRFPEEQLVRISNPRQYYCRKHRTLRGDYPSRLRRWYPSVSPGRNHRRLERNRRRPTDT